MELYKNHALLAYNTFGIPTQAEYFIEINNLSELQNILDDTVYKTMPKLILGGGSNILFTKNVKGLVIKNNIKGLITHTASPDSVLLKAQAGEIWHQTVLHTVANDWGGIENLSLIPGNIGAAPMQNIGAYGIEIKNVFYELEALHIATNTLQTFTLADCEFGYRESVFKNKYKNEFIIISVTLKLTTSGHHSYSVEYGAIKQELEQMQTTELNLKNISTAICNIRNSKLPNPAVLGNAGSFFKNPEIGAAQMQALKNNFKDIISYSLPNGNYKLAAAWLIEQCGLKGYQLNNAAVHSKQALVLVNKGNASGQNVLELADFIIKSVQDKFNVILTKEVNIY